MIIISFSGLSSFSRMPAAWPWFTPTFDTTLFIVSVSWSALEESPRASGQPFWWSWESTTLLALHQESRFEHLIPRLKLKKKCWSLPKFKLQNHHFSHKKHPLYSVLFRFLKRLTHAYLDEWVSTTRISQGSGRDTWSPALKPGFILLIPSSCLSSRIKVCIDDEQPPTEQTLMTGQGICISLSSLHSLRRSSSNSLFGTSSPKGWSWRSFVHTASTRTRLMIACSSCRIISHTGSVSRQSVPHIKCYYGFAHFAALSEFETKGLKKRSLWGFLWQCSTGLEVIFVLVQPPTRLSISQERDNEETTQGEDMMTGN